MSRKRVKQYLTLLMAIGVIAVVAGGSGTFASFTAEVTHTGNTFATGTLLLHSTSGTTTCASESNSGNANNTSPTGCTVLFNNVSIGVPGTGTLTSAITHAGGAITTIAVTNLTQNIEVGDQVKLTNGSSQTDTFTATAAVTAGSSVSVPVVSQTPVNDYAIGNSVAVQTYTQYADIQLTNSGTLDAKDIKFAIPSCTNSATQTLTLGTTTGSSLTGSVTSISLSSGAAYGAANGGTISITNSSSQTETLTLGAQVNPGATTLTVSGTLTHTYASGSTVKYEPFVSGGGTLCSNLDYSIVETDSSYHHDSTNNALLCAYGSSSSGGIGCGFSGSYVLSGPTTDTALTISDAVNSNSANELDHGQSRYFVIGVQANVGAFTNSNQNQSASFSIRWHIDQK